MSIIEEYRTALEGEKTHWGRYGQVIFNILDTESEKLAASLTEILKRNQLKRDVPNDPSLWGELILDERILPNTSSKVDRYATAAVKFVSGEQVRIQRGMRGSGRFYHHTTSIKALRKFFFGYLRDYDSLLLGEIVNRTLTNVLKNGPAKFEEHFREIGNVRTMEYKDLELPAYVTDHATHQSRITPFRRELRLGLEQLFADELLQKTPGYAHLHAVSLHPRLLR
jgi:hypothetical protein